MKPFIVVVAVVLLLPRPALGDDAPLDVVCRKADGKLKCMPLDLFLKIRDAEIAEAKAAAQAREELAAQAAHGIYKL